LNKNSRGWIKTYFIAVSCSLLFIGSVTSWHARPCRVFHSSTETLFLKTLILHCLVYIHSRAAGKS
jgi:hypothetical protein